MVDWSWSGYYVSPSIWAKSNSHAEIHRLDAVSNNWPVLDVFFWCGCEVDGEPVCNSLYSPGARWAVVLVNHALAIKESNRHDLTSTILLLYFFRPWLTLMWPDGWFIFQKGIIVMEPQLISSNGLCHKLQLITDHCEVFGASVEMSLDFIHSQEVWYPRRAQSFDSQFTRENLTNGFPAIFQFSAKAYTDWWWSSSMKVALVLIFVPVHKIFSFPPHGLNATYSLPSRNILSYFSNCQHP